MTPAYAYTPYIWPSIFVALLLFVLFVYSWKQREVPGALPFAAASFFVTVWVGASAMQLAAVDVSTKIFWYKIQGLSQLPSITSITLFLLEFVWPGRFLTRRNVILLGVPILLLWGGALTNPYHQLSWRGFTYDGTVVPIRGALNWILIAYGLGLGIINIIVLTWLFLRSPQNRWLAFFMFLSFGITRIVYILVTSGYINSILPINALMNVVPFIVYSIALFRFRVLDPIPLAHKMALEQLNAGILILDPQGKIIRLNPVGAEVLGEPGSQLTGQQIRRLMPECASVMLDLPLKGTNRMEISRESDSKTRHYQLECSTLNDWRGLMVGHLLLLHDVTEQRRSQSQILEQQRALAMLHERERLARELHDSIGQVLGYVSMQAQAIRKRAREGDMPAVEAQLSRLAEVAQEAHADVRESILSLNTQAGEDWSFPAALRKYLDAYRESFDIQTNLTLPDVFSDLWFEPEEEVQLLRVIQEAMNNTRKHGQASYVQVSFVEKEDGIQVLISDNGWGFDPELVKEGESGHYGLRFMRERAALLGGLLKVESSPGRGTSVVLEVKRR